MNKSDTAYVEANCEAVARSNMRFVPIKHIEQQTVLSLQRFRQGFLKARTVLVIKTRGPMEYFGF